MGEKTNIQWTTHTFNPWIGCSRVNSGCANCYAEADMDKRRGRAKWGPHGTRSKTSAEYWNQPKRWDGLAAAERNLWEIINENPTICTIDIAKIVRDKKVGVWLNAMAARGVIEGNKGNLGGWLPLPWQNPRVFCASLADIFEDWKGPIVDHNGNRLYHDNLGYCTESEVEHLSQLDNPCTMDDLRADLFRLIDATPHLDWLVLSKRPENIRRMIADVESSKRTSCRKCGKERRTGDRFRGSHMATSTTEVESLDSLHRVDSLQKSSGRDAKRPGISSGSSDVGQEQDLLCGTPSRLSLPSGTDSKGNHYQSQRRRQNQQSTVQPGTGYDERTEASCTASSQRQPKSSERVEASEDNSNRGGRVADPSTTSSRGSGEGHSVVVRDAAESDFCNCDSTDLEAHIKYRSNVWLLTSVSDQETANRMISELSKCRDLVPVLGVSAEPMLGPVDLSPWLSQLDWVIFGGESGPNARPCNIEWIQDGIRQCLDAGVSAFVKQLGAVAVTDDWNHTPWPNGVYFDGPEDNEGDRPLKVIVRHTKGGDPNEWPEKLRVREFPNEP